MKSSHRIVIVGASIAGLTAAESLRLEGFEGEIVLIGDEAHLPYSRPPLSKQLLMGSWEPDQTRIKSKQDLADLGIQFRGSSPALQLELNNRVVLTASGVEKFDDLIIATGAKARQLGSQGVHTLRNLEDSISLREKLSHSKSIAVIGAGVLGSEIASAGRVLGSEVILVGKAKDISFGSVRSALSKRIEDLHSTNGVELRLGSDVLDINVQEDGARFLLDSGEVVAADIAVAAVGAIPCTEWLAKSGLDISDGVICDSLGVAADGVYAIGDVAAWQDPETGAQVRVEHQTNAIEQAMSVARTIVNSAQPIAPVPFFWSDLHGVSIKAYGWFDGQSLKELTSISQSGALLGADTGGRTRGVVAWDAPVKEFRQGRSLVDESRNVSNTKTLVKDQL
jgi:NADPH-dependent 2,4-dienoyl-CoA reductase/sulfur reductase-like enzyme